MVLQKENNNNLKCSATSMKNQQMNLNQLLDIVSPDLSGSVEKLEGLESKCAVKLEEKELWSKFKEYTNEMIVTKNGR